MFKISLILLILTTITLQAVIPPFDIKSVDFKKIEIKDEKTLVISGGEGQVTSSKPVEKDIKDIPHG